MNITVSVAVTLNTCRHMLSFITVHVLLLAFIVNFYKKCIETKKKKKGLSTKLVLRENFYFLKKKKINLCQKFKYAKLVLKLCDIIALCFF